MAASPTTRYQEKQDHILAVASRVFAAKGYHQATMRDIARAAGASLAGLYYYAPSKEEILYAIASRAFDTVIEAAREALQSATDPEERLALVIRNHLSYFAAHLDEMRVLSHEAESLTHAYREAIQARKRTYVALVEGLLCELAGGRQRDDIRIAAFSLFGMMNWLYTWYRAGDDGVESIARIMTALFLKGFLAAGNGDPGPPVSG